MKFKILISIFLAALMACNATPSETSGNTHETENVITVAESQDGSKITLKKANIFAGQPSVKIMSSEISALNEEPVYLEAEIEDEEVIYAPPSEKYWVEFLNVFDEDVDPGRTSQIFWAFLQPGQHLPEEIPFEDVANVHVTLPNWPEFEILGFGATGTDRFIVVEGATQFSLENVAPGERSFYFVAKVNDATQRDTLLHIGPFLIKSGGNFLSRPE